MKKTKPITLPQALDGYRRQDTARFHMPGHKGTGMSGFFSSGLAAWDVTEINGTDNLYSPSGPIKEAQNALAEAYGAQNSFLLVNGSTGGIHAMLLYCGLQKRVLITANAHRSAIYGCALAGHTVFTAPDKIITAEIIDTSLNKNPCDMVLITSPDYYGLCADIKKIAQTVHRHGALLLVDCAHGAHFPFSKTLPLQPAEADMWSVSMHKTMNALTQGAVLNISGNIDAGRMTRVLSTIQTSSPSYLIMASLDWARHSACLSDGWGEHMRRIFSMRERLSLLNGIKVLGIEDAQKRGANDLDLSRLVIGVEQRGIDGFSALRHLEEKGVVPEMADASQMVLITSPSDPNEWYERLFEAVRTLPYGTFAPELPDYSPKPVENVCPREFVYGGQKKVPLKSAAGKIAAMPAGVYPPGTAVLFPGEIITEAAADYLIKMEKLGAELFGAERGCVQCAQNRE